MRLSMFTKNHQRFWLAASLVLAAATVVGVAHAATRLTGPTKLGVTVQRDRIIKTVGKVNAAGNKLKANVEVEFSCPSGALRYVHAFNKHTSKQWFDDYAKKPKRYTFKNVVLATTPELQQACIDGKRRFDAKLKTDMQCKSTTSKKWYPKTITVPIALECKNVISPAERPARITVRDWKHTCPEGFVFKSTKKTTPIVSTSRNAKRCVRP